MKERIYIPSLATMLTYVMVLTCISMTIAVNLRQRELTISLEIIIPFFSGLIFAIRMLSPHFIVSGSELILETRNATKIYCIDSIDKFSIIFTVTIVMTLELIIHSRASDELLIYKTDFGNTLGACRRFAKRLERATGRDVHLKAYLMGINGKLYEYPDIPESEVVKYNLLVGLSPYACLIISAIVYRIQLDHTLRRFISYAIVSVMISLSLTVILQLKLNNRRNDLTRTGTFGCVALTLTSLVPLFAFFVALTFAIMGFQIPFDY
jgi:hypothetical protein